MPKQVTLSILRLTLKFAAVKKSIVPRWRGLSVSVHKRRRRLDAHFCPWWLQLLVKLYKLPGRQKQKWERRKPGDHGQKSRTQTRRKKERKKKKKYIKECPVCGMETVVNSFLCCGAFLHPASCISLPSSFYTSRLMSGHKRSGFVLGSSKGCAP